MSIHSEGKMKMMGRKELEEDKMAAGREGDVEKW